MADVKIHHIAPVVDVHCTCLILGSFPSVRSREAGFYYAHPQNRFWKVLSAIFQCDLPVTVEQKKAILLEHHIALWDSIHSCTIEGSSDSSIKNVVPNDIESLIKGTDIKEIFCNGQSAMKYYKRYHQNLGIDVQVLPSTSPANAQYSLDRLIEIWGEVLRIC